MDADDRVTVEVQNHKGDVIQEYKLTPEEAQATPFLLEARELLKSGQPALALDKLMEAIKLTKGEQGVTDALIQAKKQFDSLGEAEEQQKAKIEASRKSILEERGQGHEIRKAVYDGTTKICPFCNGIISSERMSAHTQFWCPNKASSS